MRYDDYEEYSGRSSRNSSSRRSSSSYSDRDYDRSYSSRDYDRSYSRDYDRSYSRSYDRDFDRDYDRGYSRDYDRYGSSRSSRSSYSGFDEYDWERTAPNWDDRSSARRKSGGSSRSSSSGRSSGSRNGSSQRRSSSSSRSGSGSRNGSSRRPPADNRRRNGSSQRRPAKRKNTHLVPIILGLVLIVLAALVIKSLVGGGGSKYEIQLSSQTIVQGETAEASISGLNAAEDYDITWSSSDSGVVSVEGNGRTCTLSAKSVGTVSIAATVNDETINATVMVVKTAPGVVKIDLAETSAQVMSGKSYTIQATVIMESDDMTPAKITWSSNDSSVARVDSNGVVEARDVGTAIIKATAGEKTAEFVVEVIANPDSQAVDTTQTNGQEPEAGAEVPTDNTGSTGNTGTGTGTGTGSTGSETTGGQDTTGSGQDAGSESTGQDAAATE